MPETSDKKELIVEAIIKSLDKKNVRISREEILSKIEVPPSPEMGDYALPCFFLASKLRQDPTEIALELRSVLKNPRGFKDIQTRGPYINFFLDREKLTDNLVSEILSEKEDFGRLNLGKGKNIMVEFSQANTHKAFHVGHIRGTSIGESVSRILEFCGNKVIRANYQGDSGMHVAKWIWCYKKFHSKDKLKDDESWIASIYVGAVKRLEKSKKFQKEVEEINKKLESGDAELSKLWRQTRELSLKSFQKIYSQLNTHFDVYYFEKDMEIRGKEIVELMLKNKFAKKSEDAIIIDLQKYNLGVWVLIRKDGTILYSAKDLALVEKKFIDFPDLQKSIYVIANEQDLHFNQLVKTLEITGFGHSDRLKHISFGMVRLPTGKMSSRTGQNILYSDFLKEMAGHASKEIKKRFPKLKKEILENRALKISIAAMKYNMLKQGEQKNIIFDIKESLNFEGNSGPYILYSYARASSIIKKSKKKPNPDSKHLDKKEIELIKKMSEFEDVVMKSFEDLSPSCLANYSYQLAQVFNEFYHECPVVNSEKESFRISLVEAFRQILKNSLSLLGIDVIEEM